MWYFPNFRVDTHQYDPKLESSVRQEVGERYDPYKREKKYMYIKK